MIALLFFKLWLKLRGALKADSAKSNDELRSDGALSATKADSEPDSNAHKRPIEACSLPCEFSATDFLKENIGPKKGPETVISSGPLVRKATDEELSKHFQEKVYNGKAYPTPW